MTRSHDNDGPDLAKAKPIKSAIAYIKRLRTQGKRLDAAYRLHDALRESGITPRAGWNASLKEVRENGDDKPIELWMWHPCDGQMDERKARYDALKPLIDELRDDLTDFLIQFGQASDMRPYATAEEAVGAMLAIKMRLYLMPDGEEIGAAFTGENWSAYCDDHLNGGRMRFTAQRFNVSLDHHRAEIAELIKVGGEKSGNGWSIEAKHITGEDAAKPQAVAA